MPILKRETNAFPEDVFSLPAEAHPWGVAHVRSRQEKVLARHLVQHALPFYLPLREFWREQGGRSLVSQLPIFSGYVFHRAAPSQRELLWRSGVVAALLEVNDQDTLAAELEQIHALGQAGASFDPCPALFEGEPVRITSGPFAGYCGVVERTKGHARLIVRITLIRQAVAVEFGREVLRRVP
jgi:transcription antitermination factor NusG